FVLTEYLAAGFLFGIEQLDGSIQFQRDYGDIGIERVIGYADREQRGRAAERGAKALGIQHRAIADHARDEHAVREALQQHGATRLAVHEQVKRLAVLRQRAVAEEIVVRDAGLAAVDRFLVLLHPAPDLAQRVGFGVRNRAVRPWSDIQQQVAPHVERAGKDPDDLVGRLELQN